MPMQGSREENAVMLGKDPKRSHPLLSLPSASSITKLGCIWLAPFPPAISTITADDDARRGLLNAPLLVSRQGYVGT